MTQSSTDAIQDSTFRTPLDKPIHQLANRLGGEKPKEMERFLRFAVVGVTGAIVDLGLLLILQATFLPPADQLGEPLPTNAALATGIAFVTAVVSNFIWTTLWVYPDSRSRSRKRQLIQFTIISVIGGIFRTIWVTATFVPLGSLVSPIAFSAITAIRPDFSATLQTEAKIGQIVAQLISMAIVMLWNFFANRYWTYNDVD
jgi:putative flippase GtrA